MRERPMNLLTNRVVYQIVSGERDLPVLVRIPKQRRPSNGKLEGRPSLSSRALTKNMAPKERAHA
jgi:hypothetical protein